MTYQFFLIIRQYVFSSFLHIIMQLLFQYTVRAECLPLPRVPERSVDAWRESKRDAVVGTNAMMSRSSAARCVSK